MLSRYYAKGKVVEKDPVKAEEWFAAYVEGDGKRAREVGAFYNFPAINYKTEKKYKTAKIWFEKAVTLGNAAAYVDLGYLYRFGHGVTEDYAMAFELFNKALNLGVKGANGPLGSMYFHGDGRPRNHALALKHLLNSKYPYIYAGKLGAIYRRGLGNQRDPKEAMNWYTVASAQDDDDSMYEIAMMYRNGEVHEPDGDVKALAWFLLGAANGNFEAERMVRATNVRVSRSTALKAVEHARQTARKFGLSGKISDYLDKVAVYFRR